MSANCAICYNLLTDPFTVSHIGHSPERNAELNHRFDRPCIRRWAENRVSIGLPVTCLTCTLPIQAREIFLIRNRNELHLDIFRLIQNAFHHFPEERLAPGDFLRAAEDLIDLSEQVLNDSEREI